jgi:hypothetical protein
VNINIPHIIKENFTECRSIIKISKRINILISELKDYLETIEFEEDDVERFDRKLAKKIA